MNKKYKTIGARFSLLIVVCLLFLPSLLGCGFVDYEDCTGSRTPGTNKLCYKTDDSVKTTDSSGSPKDLNYFAKNKVTTSGNLVSNGTKVITLSPEKGATSLMHTAAAIMFKSLFNEDIAHGSYSSAVGGTISSISLFPIDVVKTTNKATSDALMSKDNFAETVIGLCVKIAAGIFIIVWSMTFINQIVNERFTMESALKGFMQLILGLAVALNAKVFVSAFVWAGDALVNQITGPAEAESIASAFGGFKNEVKGLVENSITTVSIGFKLTGIKVAVGTVWLDLGALGAVAEMVLPFAFEVLCAYQIVSQLIMRFLELLVRIAIAPIPIMMSSHSGFTSEMLRFFKSTLACAVQPVLMVIGATMFGAISEIVSDIFNKSNGSGIFAVVAMAVGFLILSAFMGKTRQLATEIVAH